MEYGCWLDLFAVAVTGPLALVKLVEKLDELPGLEAAESERRVFTRGGRHPILGAGCVCGCVGVGSVMNDA